MTENTEMQLFNDLLVEKITSFTFVCQIKKLVGDSLPMQELYALCKMTNIKQIECIQFSAN